MPALVTGGTGHVGGAIVRELVRRGDRVRVLARRSSRTAELARLGVEIAFGDILDRESVEAALAGCDTLYHAAAIYEFWIRDERALVRTEVEGTRNALEAALRRGVRKVVYTSTALTVGEPRGTVGNELTPRRPYYLSRYERAKVEAERVAIEYLERGLDVVVLLPAAVLGPGDLKPSGQGIIHVLNGRVPALFPGTMTVVDVEDVAAAHVAAAAKPAGQRYIVAGEIVSVAEFYGAACDLAGRPRLPAVPAPVARLFAEFEELRARVTGRPPRLTREALRLLVHGFRVDGAKAARELGLCYRPWRESLRSAICWYWEQGLLERRPACAGEWGEGGGRRTMGGWPRRNSNEQSELQDR
jgi:dihydroflavonol-4-reductase